MTDVTLQFVFRVAGVLTDVTSAVLSDPTGAYGAKRTDTDAIVVADGEAMTHSSTGVYEYTFTPPEQGLTYSWWVEAGYGGVTYRFEMESTDAVSATAGYYADQDDIENRIGTTALRVLSNLDNTTTSIDSDRVALALADADAQIDLVLRRNGYVVPVDSSSPDFSKLNDPAAHLAAVWLHDRREWREESPFAEARAGWEKRATDRLLELVRFGLDADRNSDQESFPEVA